MYHPTTRLLTALELLQTHGTLSGAELARRLEVSTRTVRHYLALLQDLGIPVEATPGKGGGYRLTRGYKLPPLLFTADEAVALTLGLLAARRSGLSVAAPAVEGALAKVTRVLPAEIQAQVQAIQETLVIDVDTPYIPPTSAVLLTLSRAARIQRTVQLRYRDWQGAVSERAVAPYGLVYHGGRWFLVGYCALREAQRVFRLDRIAGVEEDGAQFERPEGLDLLATVRTTLATTPGRWEIEVLLSTTLAEAQRHISASMALLEPVDDGVIVRCAVQRLRWFAHLLLGLPCDLQIRRPPELREELRALAAEAVRKAGASCGSTA